ncbi:MAG TPA: SpoIIE family protein phosphatase [Terracidiphilus sp.]|jgi:hypothetical protein|nr:SpoIIE family protein phosphatase [Terracidiphilus sp.]
MRRAALIAIVIVALAPPAFCAQSGPAAPPTIRYHHSDNPAWANPGFDDSAWPQAQNGGLPSPAYQSDGFFWVRARLQVPAGAAAPLAIESITHDAAPNVQEVWVNGRLVGRFGDFPPHANPLTHPQMLVFDIPAGVALPGSIAVIALRTWNGPDDRNESLVRRHPDRVNVEFSIASAPLLHSLANQAQDRAWLSRFWPQFSITLAFILLGLAVLALGFWARDRTLLFCALWLVVLPTFLLVGPLLSLLAGVAAPTLYTAFLIVNAIGMWVVVEFTWTVQAFRDRFFRAALHLCWIGLTIAGILATNWMHPGVLVSTGALAENWLLFAFNGITSGANLVALAGRGRNRPVAAAMFLISVGYFLGIVGIPVNFSWLGLNLFKAAFYLCTLFIAVLLMRQTWTAWRKAEDLRVEFAAARELQQQLVPTTPPAIDGWRMQAAYLPAADVGGDFYHIVQQSGATVLFVGDVSGKGLKAAMTGLLTIGAASALAGESSAPASILTRLNREMVRLQCGGFITCLCVRMAQDGSLTLANAGHLSPYQNGEEVPLQSGLPLGIAPDAIYAESTLQLVPNDRLTFLSDGVVEAQSQSGELYGFDRTAAISNQSAQAIATAAQAHGQEDDITVLTVEFLGNPLVETSSIALKLEGLTAEG